MVLGGDDMKKLGSLFLLSIVLTVSGCAAWKKIPAAPEYTHAAPIPLKVGVILLQEDTTSINDWHGEYWLGPEAIKGLKEMQLFDSLIYPYEEGPVDVVMQLIITGGWEGRTLFRDWTTTYDVRASIKKSSDLIGRYFLQATSTLESGYGYQVNHEFWEAGTTLQGKRIAFELAKKIRADRSNLLSKYSKSQEGKPFTTELAYKKGEYQNAATIIFQYKILKQDPVIEPMKEEASNSRIFHHIFHASDTSGTSSMGEEYIVSCIEKNIKKHNPDQSFISFSKFSQAMFPDNLELHVPKDLESFSTLLADVADERFYKDALSWGIRYLIFVGGGSETVGHGDLFMTAAASFPPIWLGFWGGMYWDNKTQLAASILDLHQKKTIADDIEVISEDISWLAVAAVVPVGFPSSTESDSCEDVANRISKILLERAKQ